MRIDPATGLLDIAQQVVSPNCDERPEGCEPELIVIHGISLPPGQFGGNGIDKLFTNQLDPSAHPYFAEIAGLRVSAHVMIRREGQIVQYVPFGKRAWHAGRSVYAGRQDCNDFSVGIELEGTDDIPYTGIQYQQLVQIIGALFAAYPGLSEDRIAGHCDIAPGRKTDPGPGFDWHRLRSSLKKRVGQA